LKDDSTTCEANVKKLGLILLTSLATAGAYAQGTSGGITTSTDPARAAAVEKHAQELQARQSKEPAAKPATSHASTQHAKAKTSSTHKSTAHKSSTHASTAHKSSTTKAAKAPKS
jgi:hypothetical protein